MLKNNPQRNQPQKIPFWRRRWFWGVVVGVVYVFAIQKFVRMQSGTPFTLSGAIAVAKLFFLNFHAGITVFLFFLLPPSLYAFIGPYNKIIYYFFLGFYYLFLIFALYKMFASKKAKIKYPIILIILTVLNLLGIMLATYYSQHPT